MDEVIFSIDGCDQKSLQKYQRGGDFERMLHNLRNLVVYRDARGLNVPQIEWKYLLFNWNDRPRQIAKAIWLAAGSREPVDKLLNESCSGRGESLTTQQLINSSTSPALPEASSTDQPINLATDPALPSADVISFWPTNNPAYGISWRYRLGLLNHIGTKSWKGREVRLRQSPPPRDQRSEDRDRRTEDRGRRTEDVTEVRSHEAATNTGQFCHKRSQGKQSQTSSFCVLCALSWLNHSMKV
jgi:hypothetical protein